MTPGMGFFEVIITYLQVTKIKYKQIIQGQQKVGGVCNCMGVRMFLLDDCHVYAARTKCITMEKNYDFFVRHLAQLLNSGLNALQKKAPFITKKVMDLVLFLIGRLKPLLFYFVILEKVMDLVVYLFGRLNALLF